jgi:hypothetical protein
VLARLEAQADAVQHLVLAVVRVHVLQLDQRAGTGPGGRGIGRRRQRHRRAARAGAEQAL